MLRLKSSRCRQPPESSPAASRWRGASFRTFFLPRFRAAVACVRCRDLPAALGVGIHSDGTVDATAFEEDSLTFTGKRSAGKASDVSLNWRYIAGKFAGGANQAAVIVRAHEAMAQAATASVPSSPASGTA